MGEIRVADAEKVLNSGMIQKNLLVIPEFRNGKELAEDDLVTMRRHEYPERYLSSFAQCADRVRAAIENPYQGQASLFSLICEQEDNEDYDESENCDSYEEYDDEEEYEESYDLQ